MQTKTVSFVKKRDTTNTAVFREIPEPGKPPVIGSLYVQNWFAGEASELTITIHGTAPERVPAPTARCAAQL